MISKFHFMPFLIGIYLYYISIKSQMRRFQLHQWKQLNRSAADHMSSIWPLEPPHTSVPRRLVSESFR